MKKNPIHIDPQMRDGYIPAPYVLEEGDKITDFYLEPVLFHNENGPTIGVTTCGVIVKDGLYFKDLDNSGRMALFKDWRLDDETRAADMVRHMTLPQQAGFVLNTLWNNPVVPSRAMAKKEDGSYDFSKIYRIHDPSAPPIPSPLPDVNMNVDTDDVLVKKTTAGVYRGDLFMESGMTVLYNNCGCQMLEYEAVLGNGVAIPYTLHTNPLTIGYPDYLGIGAAVLGDGNADLVYEMAVADRKIMKAAGLNVMYGPQVDVASDPRWPRNAGTYAEDPQVVSQIIRELIRGYQDGDQGLNENSVVLTVKHFPGDAPAENGFEPHMAIGQWRLYPTEGSMEKYHLPPFQAAFDMKASSIMPDYSRATTDSRSVPQFYKGKLTSDEEVPSAYSKGLLTDLAREQMGFSGYVNSDSGITTAQIYGVEDLTVPQRYAKAISAGTDVIGGNSDPENIIAAVEEGFLPKADLDRASYNRLLSLFKTKRVDNPYLDPDHADQVRAENLDGARQQAYVAAQKSVVLAKNHDHVLPMARGKKVYIECFRGETNPNSMMAKLMGAGSSTDAKDEMKSVLEKSFEVKGYTLVDTPEEADYAYLHLWPVSNTFIFEQTSMPVIDLVDGLEIDLRETNRSQKKVGKMIATTLKDVDRIKELSETVHAHGGKVVATVVVTSPWILQKVEPYCDAITFQYTTSKIAMAHTIGAQLDVLSGDYNPTGKISLTMVSCEDVIAIHEKEIDGVIREVCVSPNDVPGYDKDQYIDPAILAKVKGGSFAYCDEDGNYYRCGFGLRY